jgi:hypothetical protein
MKPEKNEIAGNYIKQAQNHQSRVLVNAGLARGCSQPETEQAKTDWDDIMESGGEIQRKLSKRYEAIKK